MSNKQETLKQAQARLAKAQKANKVSKKEAQAVASINHEIEMLTNPRAQARQASKESVVKLDMFLKKIEELEDCQDEKGKSHKIVIRPVFGYGVAVDKLLTICRTALYAKQDHKDEILDLTGLDEQSIEAVLDALGAPAYFSTTTFELVPEIECDVQELEDSIQDICDDLQLVLRTNKVNQKNISSIFEKAQYKADTIYKNTVEFIEEESIVYED